MCPVHSKIYQIINILRMMFVYHYVIIPFHPQYLPRHAPSNINREQGSKEQGSVDTEPATFLYS